MTQPSDEEHEALCRRCARCCYEKLIVDGHVFTTRKPCPYLDVKTRLCKVYTRRRQVNPRCLTVAEGIAHGVFPTDCPYVKDLPDYVPGEDGWLDDDIVEMIERGRLTRFEDVRDAMRRISFRNVDHDGYDFRDI